MPYKDKNKQREFQRKWVAKRKGEFFFNKACAKCESKENLELDHINRKDKISNRIWSWSKAKRKIEIKKCQILCNPCHKEKTRQEISVPHGGGKKGTHYKGVRCSCELCKNKNREYDRLRKREYRKTGYSPIAEATVSKAVQ